MAEEKKKDDKKGDKKEGGPSLETEVFFWVIIFIVVGLVVFPTLLGFFGYHVSAGSFSQWWTGFVFDAGRTFSAFASGLIFLAIFSSLIFILAGFYAKFKLSEIGRAQSAQPEMPGETGGKDEAILANMSDSSPFSFPTNLPGADVATDGNILKANIQPPPENQKWKEVKAHMESGNQAEWRLAIMEADILLYDMLDQMGYEGTSIGEKLKKVEPESFTTVNEAWKAHKVRNIIAHEGSSYVLSRSEAERAIRWYEQVFKEFYFI